MATEIYKMEKQGDVAIMTLILDDILHDENEKLMKSFDTLLNEGNKKIILDLSTTNYVSSLILASLVYMLKRAKDGGGNLVFCSVKNRVKEIMSVTNLDKVFDITETREEALKKVNK